MKLPVCYLIAVAVAVVTCSAMSHRSKKVNEVLTELNALRNHVQPDGPLLNTPSGDIDECCFLSALPCFSDNVKLLKTNWRIIQQKLSNNLRSSKLINAVTFTCHQYGTQGANCTSCDSYPKKNSTEFIKKLEMLLQKTNVRLVHGEK